MSSRRIWVNASRRILREREYREPVVSSGCNHPALRPRSPLPHTYTPTCSTHLASSHIVYVFPRRVSHQGSVQFIAFFSDSLLALFALSPPFPVLYYALRHRATDGEDTWIRFVIGRRKFHHCDLATGLYRALDPHNIVSLRGNKIASSSRCYLPPFDPFSRASV